MSEIYIEGYDCFCSEFNHHDRGVCIYIRDNLNSHKLDLSSNNQFNENIFCSLSLSNSDDMIIGVVYRSPNSSEYNDSNLRDLFQKANENVSNHSHLLITGDFNLPHINWNSWDVPNWDSVAGSFLDILDDYFLFQYVTFPTRNREGQSPSTLDLIITSEDNVIENLIASDPLGKSDHIVMEYDCIYSIRIPESKNSKYLYEKGDYQSFNEELMCTDWDQLFTNMSIEEMWASFHARYMSLLNKYIPTRRTSIRLNSAPLWMNKSVLSTIKVKRKA